MIRVPAATRGLRRGPFGRLKAERVRQLDALGMVWSVHDLPGPCVPPLPNPSRPPSGWNGRRSGGAARLELRNPDHLGCYHSHDQVPPPEQEGPCPSAPHPTTVGARPLDGLHHGRHHRGNHGDRSESDYDSPAGPRRQQIGDAFTLRRTALIIGLRFQPVRPQQGCKGHREVTAIIHDMAND